MPIDLDTFRAQRSPRFGDANPTRMDFAFWIEMVRSGEIAYEARQRHMGRGDALAEGPVWCFHRYGPTRTRLPDGRIVCIGGEHEDHYDPDFAIYNDVIVIGPDTSDISIFGYPSDVFPPTDFHTATLIGDRILIIGGLGYPDGRGGPVTPVYSLNLHSFAISRVSTAGAMPGWIFEHRARLSDDGRAVVIWGGELQPERGRQAAFKKNSSAWELALDEMIWRQIELPPEEPTLDIALPDSWKPAITKNDRELPIYRLQQTMPLGHPLFAAAVLPLATSYWGRVLFKMLDGSERFAHVELEDMPQRHAVLPEPTTVFFDAIDEWLAAERARE